MPPTPVEIADTILIYNAAGNTWSKGFWNLFRKEGAYKYAAINFSTAITSTIIAAVAGKRTYLSSLFFTVGGLTDITLYDGATPISGPMDFGGSAEPRGMVIPLGSFPIELGNGNYFGIKSSSAVQVSGTVVYTQE